MKSANTRDMGRQATGNEMRRAARFRTLTNDLRTMPERVSSIAASDIANLNRAAGLIEKME